VTYVFAVIGFYEYAGYFHNGSQDCDTLRHCIVVIIANGLKSGSGIGDILDPPPWKANPGETAGRMIFDALFFAICIIIFLNIIFGLIIDTFAQLREGREAMEANQKGTCFICGIDKGIIDRRTADAGGFNHHYKNDHNMWQYVYFMWYLWKKPVEELTGPEGYVHKMIQEREIGFLPMGRALMLDEGTEEDAVLDKKTQRKNVPEQPEGFVERIEAQLHGLDIRIAGRVSVLDARIRSSMAALGGELQNRREIPPH